MHKLTALLLAGVAAVQATDVVYCADWQSQYGTIGSAFVYYSDISQSQGGQAPQDIADTSKGSFTRWPGGEVVATFSDTGVTYESFIQAGADQDATGQYAGYGTNQYSNYDCFKDNGRQLTVITGSTYFSKYYCKQRS